MHLPTHAPPFGRCDLLSHGILGDQCARSTGRNSHAAPAALNPHSARGTAARSPARFPPLEAFGRRPSACAAPPFIGPASETLHKPGNALIEHTISA